MAKSNNKNKDKDKAEKKQIQSHDSDDSTKWEMEVDLGKRDDTTVDSLLDSLVFLTAHFGRAKSAQAITAGLAYDEYNMRPSLFCEAADLLGFKTQIVKKSLSEIPREVFPVVVFRNDNKACVLLDIKGNKARIYDPVIENTKSGKEENPKGKEIDWISLGALEQDYIGYSIYIHPKPEFIDPDAVDERIEDAKRHWFWGIVEDNKPIYGMVILGAVFINLFGLTSPIFIMNVYDRVIPNNAIETGWALGIGAIVVFVFDFIMRNLRGYLIDFSGRKIDVIAARRIYDQVLNMRLSKRPKSSGSFADTLRDFNSVREFFTSATITGVVDLPFTLFFLFIIYQLGGAIVVVPLILIMIVVVAGLVLQAPLKSYVRRATKSSEAKHGLLVETINGLETIKAIGADGRFRARYGGYVGENAILGQGARFISSLGVNVASYVQQTASVVIVLAGMYMVQSGDLSVGGLIACVILGGKAIAPIGQVAALMTKYHQATGALKALEKIMGQEVERPPQQHFLNRSSIHGKIAFQNVSFAYPDVDREVLSDVSFTINPGEKVGIIGRIGSGKSTIARLMMDLYEPAKGAIYADDTDYRQIDPADLRQNVAYIAQEVMLFSGSVRDNIAASIPHASEEDILLASQRAGVHDFMAHHPMGYDAPVGERGNNFSGGQRQAIALARAMLTQPNVIVCDEPTNAMDLQAEAMFKTYIQEEIKDKTFILITHKHTMLDMVDRLILMHRGRLLMDAPREQVVKALQDGKMKVEK